MRTSRIFVLLGVTLLNVLRIEAAMPEAPQNLQPAWIYEGPATYARLTWDPSDGAASYNVYRLNTDDSGWYPIRIGLTNLIDLDYNAISAPKSYVVTAINGDGESVASEIATAMDGGVFSFLHRSSSEFPEWDQRYGWVLPTSANITWLLQQTSGADGMLEFGQSTTNMTTVYFQPGYQLFGHGVTLTNLAPATPYYYRITSVSTNRVGYAEIFSLTTPDTNHPPVAGDVAFGPITETWEQPIAIPGSDLELNTGSLTARIVTQPTNGTVSAPFYTGYEGFFLVHYQPNAGARGGDFFEYVVNDGAFDSSPGTVTITNIWLNRTPQPASFATNSLEDVPLNLTLAVFEPDGDTVSFEAIGCFNGTVTGTAPNVVYTPAANFSGQDTLFYLVNDGYPGGLAQGFISITVSPVNDAPTVSNQNIESPEDSSLSVSSYAIDVEGDSISYSIVSGPTHGNLSGTPPNLSYTPAQDFVGTDQFTYQAADGNSTSDLAVVTIIVSPVNDPPVAGSLPVTTPEDTLVAIPLPAADIDGDALTVTIVSGPAHGSVFGSGLNRTYRPTVEYSGTDSFAYRVKDGAGWEATGTVSITVTPVNDAPITVGQSIMMPEDSTALIRLSASDYERDPLNVVIVSGPAHGTLSGSWSNLVYTPTADYYGYDEFVYRISDGLLQSLPAKVDFSIMPVADVPVANAQNLTAPYNTAISITLSGSDGDGDALTYAVLSQPAGGVLDGNPPNFTFTPTIGWSGITSFSFRVNDGINNSTPAVVSISVQPPAGVPTAPTGVTATAVSTSQINLTWTDTSGNNEDGFKIERSTNGNSWSQIATIGPNETTFSITGLTANKNYSFRVRAYNVLGNSPYSATASAKTLR